MTNRFCLRLLVHGLLSVIAGLSCASDSTVAKDGTIETKTPEELLQTVLGRSQPVWYFSGRDGGATWGKSATIAYLPFRSSESFCRTYVTEVHAPAWVCDGDQCLDPPETTYDVETRAFLAIAPSIDVAACSSLKLERDFFALDRDLHDREIADLLALFKDEFARWKSDNSTARGSCDPHQVSTQDLSSLSLIPADETFIVRFTLRSPCYEKHRVIFDVKMRGRQVLGSELYDQMP